MATWLEASEKYIQAAERARLTGDTDASIALAIAAARCLQVARNLTPATPPEAPEE